MISPYIDFCLRGNTSLTWSEVQKLIYPQRSQNYSFWVFGKESKAWKMTEFDHDESQTINLWPARNCREILNVTKSFSFESHGSLQAGYYSQIGCQQG